MRGELPRAGGFTLLELTLSIALLVTLTMVLFGFLRGGLGMYRSGESRRDAYERAQILLERIARDLDALAAPPRRGPGAPPVIRLLGDRDDLGRPRLRFVRRLGRETSDPILRSAGSVPGGTRAVDLVDDLTEAKEGTLAPPGGLMEVAYLMAGGGDGSGGARLYRAVRAPAGGDGSLFRDGRLPSGNAAPGAGFLPLSGGVLRLGIRYHGRGAEGRAEATDLWDSTRGVLEGFSRYRGPASLPDPRDDVIPSAIEVEIVLEEEGRAPTLLSRAVRDDAGLLPVNSTRLAGLEGGEGAVKVDAEWIQVAVRDPRTFRAVRRGLHGTIPAPHAARARVHTGATFRRIVEIPEARQDWNE